MHYKCKRTQCLLRFNKAHSQVTAWIYSKPKKLRHINTNTVFCNMPYMVHRIAVFIVRWLLYNIINIQHHLINTCNNWCSCYHKHYVQNTKNKLTPFFFDYEYTPMISALQVQTVTTVTHIVICNLHYHCDVTSSRTTDGTHVTRETASNTNLVTKLCSFDWATKWNSYGVHVQFACHNHRINHRVQYNNWVKPPLT